MDFPIWVTSWTRHDSYKLLQMASYDYTAVYFYNLPPFLLVAPGFQCLVSRLAQIFKKPLLDRQARTDSPGRLYFPVFSVFDFWIKVVWTILVRLYHLVIRVLTVAPCACCVNLYVCMYKVIIFGLFECFLSLNHFVGIFLSSPFLIAA